MIKTAILWSLWISSLALQSGFAGGASEIFRVKGRSMEPYIPDGALVSVVLDPSHALELSARDTVLYRLSPDRNPLIKMIYGVPGDKLSFQEAVPGAHYLLINGSMVENTRDQPFVLRENGKTLLGSCLKEDGTIKDDLYLILSDKADGSEDSRTFGLANRRDILGRVMEIRLRSHKHKRLVRGIVESVEARPQEAVKLW